MKVLEVRIHAVTPKPKSAISRVITGRTLHTQPSMNLLL